VSNESFFSRTNQGAIPTRKPFPKPAKGMRQKTKMTTESTLT